MRRGVLRHFVVIVSCLALAAVVGFTIVRTFDNGPRASGAISHECYIWQRDWNAGVSIAVDRAAARFGEWCILTGEVSWESGVPSIARVAIDYECLREAGTPVGLALRIGPYRGPFAELGEPIDSLAGLASERIELAASHGVDAVELQLDFDCAESNLDGYARWVAAIRRRIAPTPLTITALPSWLDRDAFRSLAAATDGYVLQVHSLERPRGPDEPMTLCDPRAARLAVERAGRLGTPFHVALPTYGYFVGFDGRGKLVGLQAEGPSAAWPAGTIVRPLRADPQALARLVQAWTADRPAALRGVIWYRLPTDRDALNWHWETLASVMAGQVPQGRIEVHAARPEPGLVEIELTNSGDADADPPNAIDVSWERGRLIASDALGGFELETRRDGAARLRASGARNFLWISPGRKRMIAWFRFDIDTEVEVHAAPGDP